MPNILFNASGVTVSYFGLKNLDYVGRFSENCKNRKKELARLVQKATRGKEEVLISKELRKKETSGMEDWKK